MIPFTNNLSLYEALCFQTMSLLSFVFPPNSIEIITFSSLKIELIFISTLEK